MSSSVFLLPEYKDEKGIWQPLLVNGNSDLCEDGDFANCLCAIGKKVSDELTLEEVNFCKYEFDSKEFDGYNENGEPVYRNIKRTINYSDIAHVVTLDDIGKAWDNAIENVKGIFASLVQDFEDSVKTIELCKIACCSKENNKIPAAFLDEYALNKSELIDYVSPSAYNSLSTCETYKVLYFMLEAFKNAGGKCNVSDNDIRFFYYID